MTRSLNILIAEDSATDAELLLRQLRRAGFEPNWKRVDSEPQFRDALRTAAVDLVLSDFEMPQFTGLTALKLLKASGLDVPFILVSGTIGEDLAVEAMKAGASDYLMKDRLGRLGSAVQHALEQCRLRHERRVADERMRESVESMTAAQEIGRFGSWEVAVTDQGELDRTSIRWSDQCFRIFGLEPGRTAVSFETFISTVHPEDAPAVRSEVLSAVRSGKPLVLEHRLQLRSGDVRFVRQAGRLAFDQSTRRPIKLLGTIHDITDERRADLALREKERLLHAADRRLAEIVNGMSEACFAVDSEWRFIFVNHQGEMLLNQPASGIVGRRFWDVFPQLVEAPVGQHFRRAMTDRVPTAFEMIGPNTHRWVEVRLSPSGAGLAAFVLDVHARKEAEAALQESERHYRLLFDDNPAPMWVYDLKTLRFLAVNEAAVNRYGFSRNEFLAMTIKDIRPPETVPALEALLREDEGGRTKPRLTCHWTKEHVVMEVEITFSDLRFAGSPARLVLANDVTERRRAEESLRLFRALMDQSKESIEVVDPITAGFIDVNEHACVSHGYTREEYLRLKVFDVHPEFSQEDFAQHPIRLKQQQRMVFEANHRRKDGSRFPVEISLNWVSLDRDYIVAMVRDITERKRGEEALRESEERFRQVVENITEVFWMTDPEKNKILYISPAYQTIWGRTCESLYANPLAWVEAIHVEDRERVLQAALSQQALGTYREEYRIVRPNGEIRWVRDRAFPIRDETGTDRRVVGVAEDITASKTLHEQLLRAQRMESVGRLASGIAHDMNNILAPIMMSAPLLRMGLPPKDVERTLTTIEISAQRGADLIKQLLLFGRGVAGERGQVLPSVLIKELLQIARETFPKNIAIKSDIPRDAWHVMGDATQLHQVLLNLCVNALDAMPLGGSLTVAVENLRFDDSNLAANPEAVAGPYVRLSVCDTGTGIPPEILDKIFDPFFTTKEVGKGTGLGLSTVLGIVKSHGGFVTVQSVVGAGTVFQVHLPAMLEPTEGNTSTDALAPPRGCGETILVVEDEEVLRNILGRVLRQHGYDVILAADGAMGTALFSAQHAQIKLVLTDLDMPVLDGFGLIPKLQKIDPAVKIVVSTGIVGGKEPQRRSVSLKELGVRAVVTKPFMPVKILRTIHSVLAGEVLE